MPGVFAIECYSDPEGVAQKLLGVDQSTLNICFLLRRQEIGDTNFLLFLDYWLLVVSGVELLAIDYNSDLSPDKASYFDIPCSVFLIHLHACLYRKYRRHQRIIFFVDSTDRIDIVSVWLLFLDQ